MNRIFVEFGPPNGGKGELQKKFCASFNLVPLGVGDVCRDHKKRDTKEWKAAHAYMTSTVSTLWPTEPLITAVQLPFEQALMRGTVVFDGWLRDEEQVDPLLRWVESHSIGAITIINIRASDELCVRRAAERGRADDADIRVRLKDFHRFSVPALKSLVLRAALPVDIVSFDADEAERVGIDFRSAQFVKGVGGAYGFAPSEIESSYNVFTDPTLAVA